MFQTEYDFTLPFGVITHDGTLARRGVMRLATAADEILPLKDPRVKANPAYLTIIVLSRVITRLEGVEPVTPNVIEGLFAADLNFLQGLYNTINQIEEQERPVTCPECRHVFALEAMPMGGSPATPSIN